MKERNSRRMLSLSLILALGLLSAGLTLASTPAQAITLDLTSDHCTGGCGTPPFGTVELIQNGSTVDVTVDLANGINWAQTGAGDFQLFKFNGTGVALGDISVDQTFAGQTLQANTGTLNGDGTGNFTFGISCATCGNGNLVIASDVEFHVANATIADLTGANNLGNIFVADIFSSQTGNTGPVDVSGTPVPEPGTLLLLGSGLASIGAWSRRRMRGHA